LLLSELTAGSVEDARTREGSLSLAAVMELAHSAPPALDALEALAPADHVQIIAEVKRASPSRGDMAAIADPAALALTSAAGGAAASSVLPEDRRFQGSLRDLDAVRSVVDIPVLRKDFIATDYQVYEARAHRADIVLLIVAALEQTELERLYALTLSLGMTALVETHSADEVARAVDLGAALIGVNARDLDTFELDRDLFARLADQIPGSTISVAESAVRTAADVAHYRSAGADIVLVGEALVTSDPIVTMAGFLAS